MSSHLARRKTRATLVTLAVVLLAAGIGSYSLIRTRAGTSAAFSEIEQGGLTGGAQIVTDPEASDGEAVRFAASPATTPNPQPTPTPPPTPEPAPAPSPSASVPAQILNLTNWKLTLPVNTAHAGSPDEILQPELATFSLQPYFTVNSARNGVVFQAHAGGATTSGSGYPRSELREMASSSGNAGNVLASWSNTSGTHTMVIKQAITHLPDVKQHVVAGQIHDAQDDVVMVRLEGKRLFIEGGGSELGVLDTDYTLGTIFTVKISAAAGRIKVYYNDVLKLDYTKSGSGYYFKAGCYTQSNTTKGDAASAYGEVIIYDLQVMHT